MEIENSMRGFNAAVDCLPPVIKNSLYALPQNVIKDIFEIRLVAGAPIVLTICGTQRFLCGNKISFLPNENTYKLTETDIKLCFSALCENSVYTHGDEIRQGYISLKNGHRAGIAGTAVYQEGELVSFRNISSINIRIAKQIKNIAAPFLPIAEQGSVLIAGPPSSGKTTFLRDITRLLSFAPQRISLIDSRGEIAAATNGIPQNEVGFCTDILSGVNKSDGIDIALRCLNPSYIVFDELGAAEEAERVRHCFFAGVKVVCSVHAGSIKELYMRNCVQNLLHCGCFHCVIFLPDVGKPPMLHYCKAGEKIA